MLKIVCQRSGDKLTDMLINSAGNNMDKGINLSTENQIDTVYILVYLACMRKSHTPVLSLITIQVIS